MDSIASCKQIYLGTCIYDDGDDNGDDDGG